MISVEMCSSLVTFLHEVCKGEGKSSYVIKCMCVCASV